VDITVRQATPDDVGAIAAINLASWEAAYRGIVADGFLDRATLESRAERWHERILAAVNPILVAEVAGVIAGYCSLALPSRDADADGGDGPTAEIGAIYVSPDAFRSGVGSAMVDAALELMRDRGFREATLWVLVDNARARGFYARQGFRPDGAVQWLDVLEAEEMRLRRAL
jgi:ribosomal protein S18 acetylase RimI-like enzyme